MSSLSQTEREILLGRIDEALRHAAFVEEQINLIKERLPESHIPERAVARTVFLNAQWTQERLRILRGLLQAQAQPHNENDRSFSFFG